MKAQRRHELQTNALADWLAKTIEQVKPHTNTIIIGVLLAAAAIAAAVYLSGRSGQGSAEAWGAYFQAIAIEDEDVEQRITELSAVAQKHPKTAPGLWARLMAGDARLIRGANAQFKKRSEGHEDLDKAQLDFESVINEAGNLPDSQRDLLLQRAHWGLAQTFDALAMGEEAAEAYQKLADGWPDSALGEAAAEKARNLRNMADWFDWYASVDPSAIKPSALQDRSDPGASPGGFEGIPFRRTDDEPPDESGGIDLGFGLDTGALTTPDATPSDDTSPSTSIFTEGEDTPADEGGESPQGETQPESETPPAGETPDAPVEPAPEGATEQP